MKDTVLEDNKNKISVKLKIFYVAIIVICVVAIIAAIIIQVKKDKIPPTITENPGISSGDKEIDDYKNEFNNIFQNKVNYMNNNSYRITKIEQDKEIIYSGYEKKEQKINDYDIDVNIPYINIQNDEIKEFNEEIVDTFEKKAKSVLSIKNNDIIYTVNYSAYISNNILSLVVRSTLKEGTNPQRDIVQTYNYDLTNKREYTIQEFLEVKGITKQQANQKIKNEIRKVQENVNKLGSLGYTVYNREPESDIYNINNVTEYFIGENNKLYIIFAYGNQNNTSEMDIVVM